MWNVLVVGMKILDQSMFLGNCPTSVNVRFGEG